MKWGFCFLFVAIFGIIDNVNAQVRKSLIKGLVVTEDSLIITGYSLKVLHPKNNRLLSFKFLSNSSPFEIGFTCNDCDTVILIINSTGYETKIVKLAINTQFEIFERITLLQSSKTLEEVKVQSRTIWHSGDTTFFNIDRFKNGSELKLEEIIKKLPGFYLDNDNTLWYRMKKIEIIRLEGEELFADKVGLLLKNIPADILETIQALENQTENDLLKGFADDNKTILNIKLKTDKLNLTIGSSEYNIGLDNKLRYQFNPVLLELKGKIKSGYIGQINNLGNLLPFSDYWQLYNPEIINAQSKTLPTSTLTFLQDVKENEYLRNSRIDQRLQLNLAANKNLRLKMEASFIKDIINQESSSLSETQLTDSILKRSTFAKTTDKPLLLIIKYTLDTWLAKNINIQSNLSLYLDKGKTSIEEELFQNDSIFFQHNNTYNDRKGIFGEFNMYSKLNSKNVLKITTNYGINKYDQTGKAQSESWKQIFNNQNNQYDHLYLALKNSQFYFKSGLTWLRKKGIHSTNYSLFIKHKKINKISNVLLSTDQPGITPELLTEISGSGNYKYTEINSGTVRRASIFKLPFSLSLNYGTSIFSINEPNEKRQKTFLNYLFRISQEKKFSQMLAGDGEIGFKREARNIQDLNHEVYPQTLNFYRIQADNSYMTSNFFIRYSLSLNFKNQKQLNFVGNYSRNFYTNIYRPDNTTIFFYSRDSLVKKPSDFLSVSVRYYMPVTKNAPGFRMSFNIIHSQHYLAIIDKIIKVNRLTISPNIEMETQIGKSLTLQLKTKGEKVVNFFAGYIGVGSLKNNFFRLSNQLCVNLKLKKETNFSSEFTVLHPDISLRNSYSFWNISVQRKFMTHKIQLGLKLLNLLNQKEFISINRDSPGNFYNANIKLNGRTFLLTAHYLF